MNITMYGTTWCSDCHVAKKILEDNDFEYKFIDIEDDDDATAFVEDENDGKRIVPTFLIDDEVYSNPDPEELEEILGID